MLRVLSIVLVAAVTATLSAADPLRAPGTAYEPQPTPAPGVEPIPVVVAKTPLPAIDQVKHDLPPIPMHVTHTPAAVPLFTNVKIRTPRHIAPCAVPQIVQVPNPCSNCCEPVFVQICVPPCKSPCVTIKRSGKITYDFGDYRVQVASRNGIVIVDYDA